MRCLVFIVVMFISVTAFCNPADSTRAAAREKAKIEREQRKIERDKQRYGRQWDERSKQQRVKDRRALIFMAVSAAILLNTMTHKE